MIPLKPKDILLSAIREKCEGTGIVKIVLVFNIVEDKYNVMFAKEDDTSVKVDIEEKEINFIKKIFIGRIVKLWKMNNDDEIKAVILQFDLKENSLGIFIENTKGKIIKFDY